MIKVGEFLGIPVYVDTKLPPHAARLVSHTYDPIEGRMRQLDNVPIVNLRPPPIQWSNP